MTRGMLHDIKVGDIKATVARYLGEERMARSFATFEQNTNQKLDDLQGGGLADHPFFRTVAGLGDRFVLGPSGAVADFPESGGCFCRYRLPARSGVRSVAA